MNTIPGWLVTQRATYDAITDLYVFDGILCAAVLRDDQGLEHLALLAETGEDSFRYVLAQLTALTAALLAEVPSPGQMRAAILHSPSIARATVPFSLDAEGVEVPVLAGDLREDELPAQD